MKTRLVGALLAPLSLGACVQPIAQPAPQNLHAPSPPAAVVSAAAQALVSKGFEIVTSDADAGILTAKRIRGPKGNADVLRCNFAQGSIADTHMKSTMTLSLTAKPASGGSDVVLNLRTLAQYPTLTGMMALADSEETCASNGTIERDLMTAIGASAAQ